MKKVCDSLGPFGDVQTCRQFGVLGRDAYRTSAGVAVVARVGGCPDFMVVVDIDGFVAVQRDQECGAQVARVGAQGERLAQSEPCRRPPAMTSCTVP